jgi:hypothetical protein
MALDTHSEKVIAFGGGPNPSTLHGETWAYDPATDTWQERTPQDAPPARAYAAMAYDSESDRVVLFGGEGDDADELLWAYDYEADAWSSYESSDGPPGWVSRHTLVYHPPSDRCILFGGSCQWDETWAYDLNSNTWTQYAPSSHPSARQNHAMVYAEPADRLLLFGGLLGCRPNPEKASAELWAFDPTVGEWEDLTREDARP